MTWEHNLSHVKQGIIIPLPSAVGGWEDNLKKWPQITYSSIFSYFVRSVATGGEAIINLKSSEAYQYLHRNKVRRVLFKEVGEPLGPSSPRAGFSFNIR